MKPVNIATRRDLVDYMWLNLPQNFFYTKKAKDKLAKMSEAEKEYESPLLQRNLEIVGKILIQATHVKQQDCDGPENYKRCYPILDLSLDQFNTTDLFSFSNETEKKEKQKEVMEWA